MDFDTLWREMEERQGQVFHTARGLAYCYELRGGEMFVNRKEKSITRSTVQMAYENAKALGGIVTGPKKLKVFRASYLYPIFIELGMIKNNKNEVLK